MTLLHQLTLFMLNAIHRERSATEIVDATFVLVRPHYATLVTLSLVSLLLALPYYLGHIVAGPTELPLGIPNWIGSLYQFITGTVVFGALTLAAADAYHGRAPDAAAALREAFRRTLPLVLVSVALWAFIALGLVLLVIPGLYVLSRNGLAPMTVMLERSGPRDAFLRSRYLTHGARRKVLAVYALTYVPLLAIGFTLMGALTAWLGAGGWVEILSSLAGSLIGPVIAVALVVLYYDRRIGREGYDLELLRASVDGTPANA